MKKLPFKLSVPYRRKRKDVVGKILPIYPPESINLYRVGSGKVKSKKEAKEIKKLLQKRYPNKKVEVMYFPEVNFVKVRVYNKKRKSSKKSKI